MTGYLLDTSVLSMLDPARELMTPALEAWLTVRGPRLFLSTVTIFETMQGIEQLALRGRAERAASLLAWTEGNIASFGERILPLDIDTSRVAGKLSAAAFANGSHPGAADIMIAATAEVHGLLLLTRNLKHFVDLGIDIADPTVSLPR
ncbi:MAG: type II toxin-antitoxin system VapC family toxin [Devosia sp.]